MKKALILLGCPESPAQTPMTVYIANKLKKMNYEVTVASTPSAMKLLEVGDPEEFYVQNKIDIDSCIEKLDEDSFNLLIGFVHRDAAVSYFITFDNIMNTHSMAIVFEKDPEIIDKFIEDISSSTSAEIISARAYHNPTPLRVKFDKKIKALEDSGAL